MINTRRTPPLPSSESDTHLLAGPYSRRKELWRTIKIAFEFIKGFRMFHFIGPAVTVFGSARFGEDHPYYKLARETSRRIALEGFTVVTGGGPGIMEAANRGANDAKRKNYGANILLPFEQAPNGFVTAVMTFKYFFVRKVMLIKYSYGFVILPGGFGTLDEFFEALTLIQTGKVYNFPVILMGTEYWGGLMHWIRDRLVAEGAVNPEDLDQIHFTDSPEEAVQILRKATEGLKLPIAKPEAVTVIQAASEAAS